MLRDLMLENRLIAKLGDTYGLFDLHREYSKEDQFYYNQEEWEQLNIDFYSRPNIPELKHEGNISGYERIIFPSEVALEAQSDDAIFHYLESDKKSGVNIIFVHGWRSESLAHYDNIYKKRFMEEGYNTYCYILPYHMERMPSNSLYSGEYFISANVNRTLIAIKRAVSDIRALVRYIREVKNEKVILIGLSVGTLISNLVCEFEQMDLHISLFYLSNLAHTIFEMDSGKYIKKDFLRNGFDKALLEESWKIINPGIRKPIIAKEKIMLISAKYDEYVCLKDADSLWNAWDRPLRHVYNSGHSGIVLMRQKILNHTIKFIRDSLQ